MCDQAKLKGSFFSKDIMVFVIFPIMAQNHCHGTLISKGKRGYFFDKLPKAPPKHFHTLIRFFKTRLILEMFNEFRLTCDILFRQL
jgi:hypothetical protein